MTQQSPSVSITRTVRALHVDDGKDQVRVDELLEQLGPRAWGPLLMAPSVLVASPLGAIPGVAIGTAILLICIAAQMLLAGRNLWVPRRVRRFELPAGKLNAAIDRCEPWMRHVDKVIGQRLVFLFEPPSHYLIPALVILLAATMFPLAFVPFGVAVPAAAVALMGIGMMARDGAVLILGLGFVLGTIGLLGWLFIAGGGTLI